MYRYNYIYIIIKNVFNHIFQMFWAFCQMQFSCRIQFKFHKTARQITSLINSYVSVWSALLSVDEQCTDGARVFIAWSSLSWLCCNRDCLSFHVCTESVDVSMLQEQNDWHFPLCLYLSLTVSLMSSKQNPC